MIASMDDPDSFKSVKPSRSSKVNDTKTDTKSVTTVFKGDEAKVLSIILTEYSRNMSKLLMAGRIKQTPELEKELVTVATILERLAEADFSLRVDKEMLRTFGFTM